jgi:hypothetical protein
MTLAMNVGLMGSPKDHIEHGADRENGVLAITVGPMSPVPDASDRDNRRHAARRPTNPMDPMSPMPVACTVRIGRRPLALGPHRA